MSEIVCIACGKPVVQIGPGRARQYCSRSCYRKTYRLKPRAPVILSERVACKTCTASFERTKRHQLYCCRRCYELGCNDEHRDKKSAYARKKRIENPEWFQQREPLYAKKHKAKMFSTRPWNYLLTSAKNRAKERGLVFELTHEWAKERWTGRCEITGLEFRQGKKPGPQPFSPSIDRIHAHIGYTKENCRFVVWGCNAIKGVGTDADMYEIAAAITTSHKGLSDAPFGHTSSIFEQTNQIYQNNILQR